MKLLVALTVALLVAVIWTSAATAVPRVPTVELLSVTDKVSAESLQAALPAFQRAVSYEFAPVWGTDALLFVGDAAHPSPADMTIVVSDNPDCLFCGGYHWKMKGKPYAKVFWLEDEAWQLILTHELFEMLVDPLANRYSRWGGKTWIVEVADAVESGYYSHLIDGVVISDFITPAWFGGAGPYDFGGHLSRPGQILRHGYSSYLKPDGRWGQVFGFDADRREARDEAAHKLPAVTASTR